MNRIDRNSRTIRSAHRLQRMGDVSDYRKNGARVVLWQRGALRQAEQRYMQYAGRINYAPNVIA